MPTAAKLFAALCFAFTGFFAAELSKPAFPEGTRFGLYPVIVAGLGLVIGWRVMGPRAHSARTLSDAAGSGLLTAVVLAFWAFLGFSCWEMLQRALARRFDDLGEAITGILRIVVEYAQILAGAPLAIGWLAAGGIVSGLVAWWGARRFS